MSTTPATAHQVAAATRLIRAAADTATSSEDLYALLGALLEHCWNLEHLTKTIAHKHQTDPLLADQLTAIRRCLAVTGAAIDTAHNTAANIGTP